MAVLHHLVLVLGLLGVVAPGSPVRLQKPTVDQHVIHTKPVPVSKMDIEKEDQKNSVSRIMMYRGSFLCSGVHLKPWILLTVGTCVYNKSKETIYAIVRLTPNGKPSEVRIADISFPSYFNPNHLHYNVALVKIYADMTWGIQSFNLPRIEYTPSQLATLDTYIYFWTHKPNSEKYELERGAVEVAPDFVSGCGIMPCTKNWYCVKKVFQHPVHAILGSPVFIFTGKIKRIIGIYTGYSANASAPNFVFYDIIHTANWIEELCS